MGSIQQALLQNNLISQDEFDTSESCDDIDDCQPNQKHFIKSKEENALYLDKSLRTLSITTVVKIFRHLALEILLVYDDIETIATIKQLAHRLKGEPGSKKLLWQINEVNKTLLLLPHTKREVFLRRGLRNSKATFEPVK